jgi:hypothetical protein
MSAPAGQLDTSAPDLPTIRDAAVHSHRQRRRQLDSIPKPLNPEVLIKPMLIVVMISDCDHDRSSSKRTFDHLRR